MELDNLHGADGQVVRVPAHTAECPQENRGTLHFPFPSLSEESAKAQQVSALPDREWPAGNLPGLSASD